ncbi:MAG: ABC transporter permease [Lachnospiraceae bacterium]|nr:ABC transporter permease [Lachnospiraceae bacterium]
MSLKSGGAVTVQADSPVSAHRSLQNERSFSARRFILQWEWLLLLLFIVVNVINASISPNYLVFDNLMHAFMVFSDRAILVFPMMMIILMGDIDISIASTMALSAVVMGVSYNVGLPMIPAIVLALMVGTTCGLFNGVLLAKFKELSPIIVTLVGMILFRGIASIMLENRAAGDFPSWFRNLGWGYVGRVPIVFIFIIVQALVFGYMIHFTEFGRNLYAIGNNETAAKYSGVKTDKIRTIVFMTMGLFAAISGIFLASRMGSVRPSMALGYEMDVIAMVVLGGVSNLGGKGRLIGVVIATFIVGFLRFGLGIANVPSQVIMIIVGALLIVAVIIPNIKATLYGSKWHKTIIKKRKGN